MSWITKQSCCSLQSLFRICLVFLCLQFFLVANEESLIHESVGKELFNRGWEEFRCGCYQRAFYLFQQALQEDPSNIVLNYYLGRAAFESEEFEEALFAYDRVLILDPHHLPARFERARTKLMLGSEREAKSELCTLLETNPPPEIYCPTKCLLTQLEPPREHLFRGVLIASYTWDSNVTLGNRSAIPLSPSLTSDPTQRSDHVRNFSLILGHCYPLFSEGFSWKNQIVTYLSDNEKVDSNDLRLFGLESGLQYRCEQHVFDTSLAWMTLHLQEHLYQLNRRVMFQYCYHVNCKICLKSSIHYTWRHHFERNPGISETFGLVGVANLGVSYRPSDCWCWSLDGSRKYDKAPRDGQKPLAYYRNEIFLSNEMPVIQCIKARIRVGYRRDRYQVYHPITIYSHKKRNDDAFLFSTTLYSDFSQGYSAGILYEHTDNHSNIPFNTYTVNRLTTVLAKTF